MSARKVHFLWMQVNLDSLFNTVPQHLFRCLQSNLLYTSRTAKFSRWRKDVSLCGEINAFLASVLLSYLFPFARQNFQRCSFLPTLSLPWLLIFSFLLEFELTAIKTERKIAVISSHWICPLYQDMKQPAFSWLVMLFILLGKKLRMCSPTKEGLCPSPGILIHLKHIGLIFFSSVQLNSSFLMKLKIVIEIWG